MSLDVYLELEGTAATGSSGIWIREDGRVKIISREGWGERYPDREPIELVEDTSTSSCVFHYNITHNLGRMAEAAGLYSYLWRPEEAHIARARQLVEPLEMGLYVLQSGPERFRACNPKNGWGSYEGLVEFVAAYLKACKAWPDAKVRVWR